ncbi:MAG TPA: leucine zipper domain-containing protein [Mycobacterium sp.]|nr:leucine zipper domain-containing protein [Mycobacterium sp.]
MRELSVAEQRYQAVLAVISDGLSISQVAEKVGVSRQTLHAGLARYEAQGLEGLVDRSHRPVSCPQQMPADVEAVVLELRRSRPHCAKWSARCQVCALRLDVHAAPPLHVLQQLPRELLLAEEPCGLKRGRRACQRIGLG